MLFWAERQNKGGHVWQREVLKLSYCPCVLSKPTSFLRAIE
jgi:hypothetical protein